MMEKLMEQEAMMEEQADQQVNWTSFKSFFASHKSVSKAEWFINPYLFIRLFETSQCVLVLIQTGVNKYRNICINEMHFFIIFFPTY